jgi:hypothetical protein
MKDTVSNASGPREIYPKDRSAKATRERARGRWRERVTREDQSLMDVWARVSMFVMDGVGCGESGSCGQGRSGGGDGQVAERLGQTGMGKGKWRKTKG